MDPRKAQLNQESNAQLVKDEDDKKAIIKPEDDEISYQMEKKNLKKKMVILLFCAYSAGIGAGTLGIGGGMIMNPVLLSMGVDTEVAAAVAGLSVLFTSSSTTSQFAIAGAIDIQQAFIFLIFSAIGSLFGNFIILRAVDKYKRPSILIWILFGILSAACLVLPAMGIWKSLQRPNVWEFDSPC